MSKKSRKAERKQWHHAERIKMIAAMPLPPIKLHALLEHLDATLRNCDHTSNLTTAFLDAEHLQKEPVLAWLREHGGYCDCEVLANLEDFALLLEASPSPGPRVALPPKQLQTARPLQTVAGWRLTGLPSPWRVANLYLGSEPLCLSLGKGNGCTLTIIESSLPPGDQTSDGYWSALWYKRAKLPPKGAPQVSHDVVVLPAGFRSTLVRAPAWTPVYCWVIPAESLWHIEVRSESNRVAGDLPQIASLISRLESEKV